MAKFKDKTLQMYFSGVPVTNVRIDAPLPRHTPMYTMSDNGRLLSVGMYNTTPEPSIITATAVGWNSREAIHGLVSGLHDMNLAALGHGMQCLYCNHFNPAGTGVCMRCGGVQEEVRYSTISGITGYLGEMNEEHGLDHSSTTFTVYIDYESAGQVIEAVRRGLYYTHHIDMGYYLCQFCGLAVREGDDCHGCGGVRMPMSEIVKIDRKCLYCGTKTFGNLYCDSCGSRVSGRTLADFNR